MSRGVVVATRPDGPGAPAYHGPVHGIRSAPWLHPDIEVRSSAIAGQGLFALAPIEPGVTVASFGGRLVSDDQLLALFESSEYVDSLSLDKDLNLVMPGRSPNGYGNHSCDPNLWWEDPALLIARRRIMRDEEVTVDYATFTDDPEYAMECTCQSSVCRETVTGRDWERAELRLRYRAHWSPAIRRHFSSAERRT
ncbi:SET domain-containing protein [Microbacterium sp. KUDC0406]|uniref:SET domain-containing protein n=1 Tax=Microbacterium sp. KUDC0406 TaxID=2909588 RepID=UPI003FA5662B